MTVATKTKLHESVGHAFREGAGSGSRREATLIRAGWGSSGYYSPEVLERDIPRIFPAGTQMYLNHPTAEEDQMRPERDLRDLVGKTIESPRMAGVDSVAPVTVYEHWRPVIDAIAEDVGLSIRAFGQVEEGDAGGKHGTIIQSLTEGLSVDYVTRAGAGGKLGPLIEQAREHTPSPIDQAVTAYNAIMESAGQPTIDVETLKEVLSHGNSDLFEVANKLADSIDWSELEEAEKFYDEFLERDVSKDERISLAKKGQAIPIKDDSGTVIGGRFPMANCEDVKAASMSVGRGKGQDVKGFIKKVASKLSCPVPFKEAAPPPKPKENTMAENATLESLQESVRRLEEDAKTRDEEAKGKIKEAETRAERAEEALLRSKAAGIVAAVVNEKEDLPAKAKGRIVESAMSGNLPMTSDGSLDEGALQERARNEIRKEMEYLGDLLGKGKVNGVGPSSTKSSFLENKDRDEGQTSDDTKALEESFRKSGMSESQAKAAAEGR